MSCMRWENVFLSFWVFLWLKGGEMFWCWGKKRGGGQNIEREGALLFERVWECFPSCDVVGLYGAAFVFYSPPLKKIEGDEDAPWIEPDPDRRPESTTTQPWVLGKGTRRFFIDSKRNVLGDAFAMCRIRMEWDSSFFLGEGGGGLGDGYNLCEDDRFKNTLKFQLRLIIS